MSKEMEFHSTRRMVFFFYIEHSSSKVFWPFFFHELKHILYVEFSIVNFSLHRSLLVSDENCKMA
jgi:hypothetical protein